MHNFIKDDKGRLHLRIDPGAEKLDGHLLQPLNLLLKLADEHTRTKITKFSENNPSKAIFSAEFKPDKLPQPIIISLEKNSLIKINTTYYVLGTKLSKTSPSKPDAARVKKIKYCFQKDDGSYKRVEFPDSQAFAIKIFNGRIYLSRIAFRDKVTQEKNNLVTKLKDNKGDLAFYETPQKLNAYLLMTFKQGPNLLEYLFNKKNVSISFQAKIEIILKIIEQIVEFHNSGCIYSDLKPENIIFNPITLELAFIDAGSFTGNDNIPTTSTYAPPHRNFSQLEYEATAFAGTVAIVLSSKFSVLQIQDEDEVKKFNLNNVLLPKEISILNSSSNIGNAKKIDGYDFECIYKDCDVQNFREKEVLDVITKILKKLDTCGQVYRDTFGKLTYASRIYQFKDYYYDSLLELKKSIETFLKNEQNSQENKKLEAQSKEDQSQKTETKVEPFDGSSLDKMQATDNKEKNEKNTIVFFKEAFDSLSLTHPDHQTKDRLQKNLKIPPPRP